MPLDQGRLNVSATFGGARRWAETTSAGGDAMGSETAGGHQPVDALLMAARALGIIFLGGQYQTLEFTLAVAALVFV